MISEDNKKNRIMEHAFKKFTTVGISQVTMDDIARGVGMGKGTLYKYFPSKEILLNNTVDFFAVRIERAIEDIMSDDQLTPIEKLSIFLKTIAERLSSINPGIIIYLERSMPEIYEKIEKTRERIIMTNIVKLFSEGKRSGLFEPQMDEYLVAHILIGAVNHITEARVMTNMEYSFDQLFSSITTTVLKGCLTREGRELT